MDKIEQKDFSFELKELKDNSFSGYASVFGVKDEGADIVVKGAFTATIADLKSKNRVLPMLWAHRSDTPIGGYKTLREDDYGLYCEGEFTAGVAKAAETHALMKAGVISGLSIGFQSIDYEIDNNANVRKLKELKLFEISPVTFPMLDIARVTDVKSDVLDLDPRELEQLLRSAGLSKPDAVKAIGVVKKHLQRDAGVHRSPARDVAGLNSVLEAIRATRKLTAV